MFKNPFKISSATKQLFGNSGISFSQVGASAYDLASHTYNASNAAWDVANQAFKATLAGGFASLLGAGLFVTGSLLMPVSIGAAVGGFGYFVATNPLTMIVGANILAAAANSKPIIDLAVNSAKAATDAVSVPYYAAKGLVQGVAGTGKAVHDVADNVAKIIRTPNQTEIDNAKGIHATTIDGKEFDDILTAVNIKAEVDQFKAFAGSELNYASIISSEELHDASIIGDSDTIAAAAA